MYLTSDKHHDHRKIIEYVNRPFQGVREMDSTLLENTLDVLSDGDVLFDLGDFSMVGPSRVNYYETLAKKYRKKGFAHHLIYGNHDQLKPHTYVNIGLFDSTHTAFWLPYKEYLVIMAHDPSVWTATKDMADKLIFVHGHVHDLYRTIPGKPVFNVGVDVNAFKPLHMDEIIDTLKSEGSLS